MGIKNQGKDPWPTLFSRTRRRVLALLFADPGRSFYLTEVVNLAGTGTGSVQRELVRLEGAGILSKRRVGNQVHYRANTKGEFFNEIRSMVIKSSGASTSPPPQWVDAVKQLSPRPEQVIWYPATDGKPAGLLVITEDLSRDELARQLGIEDWETPPGVVLLRPQRFRELVTAQEPRLMSLLRQPATLLVGDVVEGLSLNVYGDP